MHCFCCSFIDLNPRTDAARINLIYQQAKWSLISEEVDCSEEAMMMFATLQVCQSHQSIHQKISLFHFTSSGEPSLRRRVFWYGVHTVVGSACH